MILISAMSDTRVIGAGDGMPWNVPEEYQQFLDLVAGQTIFMGRRSYEIFGPDLTTEHTIVLTRSSRLGEGVVTAATLEDAITLAASYGKTVFCGGGSSVYEQALPLADAMYLSYIKGDFTGDAYFPAFDETEWRIVEDRGHARFRFVHYERV
ncbi:MAG: dihydrofolate reductase [Planctomycetota bacterium]